MTTNTKDPGLKKHKLATLAAFLKCQPDDLTEIEWKHWGLDTFVLDSQEYAIGTNAEADKACAEYIEETAWAFNAEFIISQCDLPYELAEPIQAWQEKKCESANEGIAALIKKTCGMESFVRTAIACDGRGHFLSGYDGEENKKDKFYIYKV